MITPKRGQNDHKFHLMLKVNPLGLAASGLHQFKEKAKTTQSF